MGALGLSCAKHLAVTEAINISALASSGPGGRIIERDVKAALENRPDDAPGKKLLRQKMWSRKAVPGWRAWQDPLIWFPSNAVYAADFEDRKSPIR